VAATLFGLLPCACAPQSRLHLTQRSHMICAANACACPERPVMRRPTVGKRETPFAPRCFSTCVDALSLQKKTKEETRGEGGGDEVSLATVLQHLPSRAVIASASREQKSPMFPQKGSTFWQWSPKFPQKGSAFPQKSHTFPQKNSHFGNGVLHFCKRAL